MGRTTPRTSMSMRTTWTSIWTVRTAPGAKKQRCFTTTPSSSRLNLRASPRSGCPTADPYTGRTSLSTACCSAPTAPLWSTSARGSATTSSSAPSHCPSPSPSRPMPRRAAPSLRRSQTATWRWPSASPTRGRSTARDTCRSARTSWPPRPAAGTARCTSSTSTAPRPRRPPAPTPRPTGTSSSCGATRRRGTGCLGTSARRGTS
mmetsp:Transcript_75239/g.201652  ORF Transcript_75239/g.201652 Transcript_75239/m.201652 type:complete len:205 (+) Transcript_75239:231-845(+)